MTYLRLIRFVGLISISLHFNICHAQFQNKKLGGNEKSIKRIMEFLYSNYDTNKHRSVWLTSDTSILNEYSINSKFEILSKALSCDSSFENGIKEYYLVVSSIPNKSEYQCHECAPVEEFFICSEIGSNLKLSYKKKINMLGNWGENCPFEAKKVGKSLIYIFKPGTTSAGITAESVMIYAYFNAEFKKLLYLKDAYMDNDGDCDLSVQNSCWKYEYKISFIDSTKSYSNFILLKKGTFKKGKKLLKIDSHEIYKFTNGVYIKS
jgi:hypothetical protein